MKIKFLVTITVLLLFTGITKAQKSNPKQFKILSYNILEGFKKDSSKRRSFIQWADSIKADVIALQEVNHYSHADIEKLAQEMGYPYAVLLKEKGYPTGLISKYPISNIKRVTDGLVHGYIYGQIKDYHFIVLHLNPLSYEKRQAEIACVLDDAKSLPKKSKVLMMGDFNSLSPQDSSAYNSNDRKLKLLQNQELKRPNIKNLHNGKIDYSVMQSILAAGFIDSWKYLHPTSYEKSAPTPIIKTSADNYVRVDYILVSKRLKKKIAKAYIIKDELTHQLSDHYPTVLILK